MSTSQVVFSNKPGPLPLSIEYTPISDEPVTIICSGSVQSHDIAEMQVGFNVEINGEPIGQSLILSSSSSDYRFATVPAMISTPLPFVIKDQEVVPITITLTPYSSDSTTNKEDLFNLCIIN